MLSMDANECCIRFLDLNGRSTEPPATVRASLQIFSLHSLYRSCTANGCLSLLAHRLTRPTIAGIRFQSQSFWSTSRRKSRLLRACQLRNAAPSNVDEQHCKLDAALVLHDPDCHVSRCHLPECLLCPQHLTASWKQTMRLSTCALWTVTTSTCL